MRIVFVVTAYPLVASLSDYWEYGLCQMHQASALAELGHDVHVVSRFPEEHEVSRDNVRYHFIRDQYENCLRGWQFPSTIAKTIEDLAPDVVHVHGLSNIALMLGLRLRLPRKTDIFAEYHGEGWSGWPLSILQGMTLKLMNGTIFSNAKRQENWQKKFSLPAEKSHYCVECAPYRIAYAQSLAREKTGWQGKPVLLWNSRAISRRNPILVVTAFEKFVERNCETKCHFYMMVPDYETDVLNELQTLVRRSKWLPGRFTLIVGRRPQSGMTDFYCSADYIISGSEDDPYGYGIVDGMSCGLIPIVPRSASFLEITQNGRVGFLWDLHDIESLVSVFENIPNDAETLLQETHKTKRLFEENLSKKAQGSALERIYRRD